MSSPKTPKTPQRRRLSLKEKIKIIEDSKKPGFDKAKVMKEYGISRPTIINILKNQFDTLKAVDSRLKLTRTHIVTPLSLWLRLNYYSPKMRGHR